MGGQWGMMVLRMRFLADVGRGVGHACGFELADWDLWAASPFRGGGAGGGGPRGGVFGRGACTGLSVGRGDVDNGLGSCESRCISYKNTGTCLLRVILHVAHGGGTGTGCNLRRFFWGYGASEVVGITVFVLSGHGRGKLFKGMSE